jgi:hypothetical protein
MLIKFIYLVRSELTLTKLESCSLSREIGILFMRVRPRHVGGGI